MVAVVVVARAADAGGWDDRFNVRGMDGPVLAMLTGGGYVYAAGAFDAAGKATAASAARWDGARWSALGSGVGGTYPFIQALAWDGSNLYAGGTFTTAGGVPANYVARWDGTDWSPLGSGMNADVYALAWDGTSLYAGGSFGAAGGVPASGIARWDGTSWSSVGGGVDGYLSALVWTGSSLYAGGQFTTAGAVTASNIASWDGRGWSALGSGVGGGVQPNVYALAWDGSELYAGGTFTLAGGAPASNIARWDGSSWRPLGSGAGGRYPGVYALAWDGTDLYVGGTFETAGGWSAPGVARWDGSTWNSLGTGVVGAVVSLVWDGSQLYAGGHFNEAGGVRAGHIAKWDRATWSALPATGEGINGGGNDSVDALASDGSGFFAGGDFGAAGGVAAIYAARWDGTSWSPLAGTSGGLGYGWVSALKWDGTALYAGGGFTSASGVPVNHIARWDGAHWNPLGAGMGGVSYPDVLSLEWDGANLYAGGTFTTAGGAPASHIARWDGTGWTSLGGGTNGKVYALLWDGTNLYAGGEFTTAASIPANHIARWDGTSWNALLSGTSGPVAAVAWDGSAIYAGGYFGLAGGVPANNIARWDGTSWSPLGNGVNGVVRSLAWVESSLYVGGTFTTAGGVPASRVARWDGTNWSAVGGGIGTGRYPVVRALTWDGASLYAGGGFASAGAHASDRIARWTCTTIALSPTMPPTATSGAPYTATFSATGGTSPYTFAVTTGTAPPGLSLSPSGVLSGTPTTPGVYWFTVTATDADTCAGSVDVVLIVNPPGCPAIAIAPAALPDSLRGVAYAQTLTASGGMAPYTFAVASGALPTGLALSPAGVLSGTPTASGTFPFTAAATDAAGCAGMRAYALLVSGGTGNVVAGQGLGPPSPNRVRVFAGDGRPAGTDFLAYGAGSWGVSIAAGDLGADPRRVEQIATGPGPGPVLGPHVRAYLRDGTPIAKVSFYAYGTLRYGVNPGAGRLDADGFDEILTGAGAGAVFGPHVRGWNYDGAALTAIAKISYFAYGTLRHGVNVHRGVVDGDAFAEILTGPGPGAMFGPQVRGFDYDGVAVTSISKINFDAFATPGYGVNLAGGSVDLDAFDEIACATGPGPAFTPDFRGFGYDGSSVTTLPLFALKLSTSTHYGGRVGLGDVTGDALAELLAGKGRDPGADARVSRYDYVTGSLVAMPWFDAFPGAGYGVNPAGMDGGF